MRTKNVYRPETLRLCAIILGGVLIAVATVVAVPFRSVLSSSLSGAERIGSQPRSENTRRSRYASSRLSGPLTPLLPAVAAETIATFASDCTTPKISFSLGDQVCAKVQGVTETD